MIGAKKPRTLAIASLSLALLAGSSASRAQNGPEGLAPIFLDGFESGDYFGWSAAEFGAADNTPPEIFLLAPPRPAVYNEDSPPIEVGYFDLDSGIEPAGLRLAVDGADLLPGCTVGADSASCPSGPLALGAHEITASVWDLAGNRSTGAWTFEIAVDSVAPTLGFELWDGTGPDLDIVYNDETPVFTLDYQDDLAGVDPESVAVIVDGTTPVACVAGPDGAFCETPVLAAGTHQLQAMIKDYGGNPATATFDFQLFFDDQPPTMTLTALPAAPRTGEDLQITLSYGDLGLGLDLATVRLEVNGVDRTHLCSIGTDTATCQSPAGNVGGHVLTGHVKDIAGNETRDLLRYRVVAADLTAPVVSLQEPAEGEILTTADPVLRFTVTDDDTGLDQTSVQVLLDATDLTPTCSEAGGVFTCPVIGLGRGLHQLEVAAADLAGNGASTLFSFAAQFPVAVTITQPVEGTLLPAGGSVDVSGTVAAGTLAVAVNGLAATVAGGTFSLVGLSLHEGANVLNAVARDASGNVGYDTVEVHVDGTRPRLSLEYPPGGSVHFEPRVTVQGMVHDPGLGSTTSDQVTVTVGGQPALVGHRSFRAEDVPLLPGSNVLAIEAVDLAGNSRVEALEVFYEPSPNNGRLIKVSGDLQSAPILSPLALPLVAQLVDGDGNPRAGETVAWAVARGNGHFTGGERRLLTVTDGAGQVSAGWVLGSRGGLGVQRVEATVAGVGTASFAATATTGAAERIHLVSGDGQQGAPGQSLARPLQVVVTDSGQNPVAGVEVSFEVIAGGGTFSGGTSVLGLTDSRGYASADLDLGAALGIGAHQVEASFAGQSQLPVLFRASAFLEGDPAATSLSGVVLDNAGVPVPGYTLRLLGSTVEATSGPAGEFTLAGAPVGHQFLIADGSTASGPGTWPSLEFEIFLLAGIDNPMSRPIFVLPLDTPGGVITGGPEEALIEIPEVPGFSLRVTPGSVTFPDGSTTGVISATAVHADKIPMAPPEGLQPRFIVTIQPAGATFDPPAPVTFPNVDGLNPGTVTEMFSFDHDLGSFVSIGTGTVSGDGTVIASDPGFGITKAGWHCAAPSGGRGQSGALSVKYLGPDPLVLLAGSSFLLQEEDIEAAGKPARDGEYRWNVEDSSIAEVTGPTCAGQPMCPGTVTSAAPGQTLGNVRFICTATGARADRDFDIVVARLRLAEVSFSGDSYQEVADDAGNPYSAPHWKDNSQPPDGDASDPPAADGTGGDRRFPVSFKRNTKMKVTAKFALEPNAPSIESLRIRGIGPPGISIPATEATVAGGFVEITDVEMEEALADVVAFHNPMVIDWEASVDEGRTWSPVGRSDNRVYVTLGRAESFEERPLFESLVEIGCRNAAGARTSQQAFDMIWQDFQDPLPGVQRKALDGYNQPDGLAMRYWIDISDPNSQVALACFSVRNMLTPEPLADYLHGVGTCSAWSEFLVSVLFSQGIKEARILKVDAKNQADQTGLLVKEWLFVGSGTLRGRCGTFTHRPEVDLLDQVGVPGQGVENPPANFNLHYIVRSLGKYYDPSYGNGPFQGATEDEAARNWKNHSLAGFSQNCRDIGDAGRRVRTNKTEVVLEELEGGVAP